MQRISSSKVLLNSCHLNDCECCPQTQRPIKATPKRQRSGRFHCCSVHRTYRHVFRTLVSLRNKTVEEIRPQIL